MFSKSWDLRSGTTAPLSRRNISVARFMSNFWTLWEKLSDFREEEKCGNVILLSADKNLKNSPKQIHT